MGPRSFIPCLRVENKAHCSFTSSGPPPGSPCQGLMKQNCFVSVSTPVTTIACFWPQYTLTLSGPTSSSHVLSEAVVETKWWMHGNSPRAVAATVCLSSASVVVVLIPAFVSFVVMSETGLLRHLYNIW